jgi:hypothetical protein
LSIHPDAANTAFLIVGQTTLLRVATMSVALHVHTPDIWVASPGVVRHAGVGLTRSWPHWHVACHILAALTSPYQRVERHAGIGLAMPSRRLPYWRWACPAFMSFDTLASGLPSLQRAGMGWPHRRVIQHFGVGFARLRFVRRLGVGFAMASCRLTRRRPVFAACALARSKTSARSCFQVLGPYVLSFDPLSFHTRAG